MKKGNGLLAEMKTVELNDNITSEDMSNFIKDVFSNVPKTPRYVTLGYDFISTMRENHGDEYAYNFICGTHILAGEDTLNYIEDFVKEYENSLISKLK